MGDSSLVGREIEIARLDSALSEAPEHGGALLISGDAGIGKTSLLDVAAAGARDRGYKVLTVTGVESEAGLPFAGLHQLLQPVLMSAGALPAPQAAALLTALGMRAGSPPEVFLVALATLNLIDEVAGEGPIVLVADDVQWLDEPTSSVLTFIARRLESTHIVVVIGLREGFKSSLRSAHLPEIQVRPLSDRASQELLDLVAPDLEHEQRRLILEEAMGNPLALVELPRSLKQTDNSGQIVHRSLPLTNRLERTFFAQASGFPRDTQISLLLIALDDNPTVSDVLGAARIQANHEVSVDALQPALNAGLISIDGPLVRFRHPLMRSALDQSATAVERRTAHLALAQVIADPDRRAWHRASSVLGTDEDAATELEATAARAEARGASKIALRALELAASLTAEGPVRAGRLLAAAESAFQLGEPTAVARLLDSVAKLELMPNDIARMTWLQEIFHDGEVHQVVTWWNRPDVLAMTIEQTDHESEVAPGDPNAVSNLLSVARDASLRGELDLAFKLLQGAALRCWWTDPGETTKAPVLLAVDEIAGESLDPRALGILSLVAPVDASSRISERVREAARLDVGDAVRTQLLAFAAYGAGDLTQAIELMDRAAPLLRAQGRLGLLAQGLAVRARASIDVGRFQEATSQAEEGNRLAIETGQPIWAALSQIDLAILQGLRGDEALAEKLISQAGEPFIAGHLGILIAEGELARGITAMTAGRYSDAFDHFVSILEPGGPAHHEFVSQTTAPYVIECAVRAGRLDDARGILMKLDALGQRTPAVLVRVGIQYGQALLTDETEAEGLFERALEVAPKWPFYIARLQMSFGTWLRRQRRITESRPHLRAARETFLSLGLDPWADKAAVELRASGERIAELTVTLRQALSPQELQIAQMAASGLSNREIAARLFLSHRTVGAHLYRIFPKLGIVSRSEIAGALAIREEPPSS